jgi:hypothetical protein
MAARKKAIEKAVSPLDQPERFRMGELGSLGIRHFGGVTQDELKAELNWPRSINTFRDMSYHSAVNAPLTLFENIISKATWTYKPPADATEEEKNQAKIINQMMQDMEQPWSEFIRDVLSSNVFGFSVHEKVFRKRLKANGSLYDDGIIGWKKLPIRVQESISKFIFSEDGNEIIGVQQNLSSINDTYNRFSKRANLINIPRSKFLLFRTGKHRGDPFGKSPLRDAYLAWRFLSALEELEATGVAKDLNGLPVLYLPAQYLATDAPPEVQAIRLYYENVMRNLQMNEQSAVILPQMIEPESRTQMFKLDLLSVDGKKNFDISKIKEYYKTLIFVSLFADILIQGTTSTGSFALGTIKNSLSGAYAERLISSIAEVLQNDLIKMTYQLNGWDESRMGKFDFDGIEPADLDTFSSAIMRMGASGYVPKTLEVINAVLSNLGIDPLPEDTVLEDILPESKSRSGDGAAAGTGNGTSNSVASQDNSIANMSNAP